MELRHTERSSHPFQPSWGQVPVPTPWSPFPAHQERETSQHWGSAKENAQIRETRLRIQAGSAQEQAGRAFPLLKPFGERQQHPCASSATTLLKIYPQQLQKSEITFLVEHCPLWVCFSFLVPPDDRGLMNNYKASVSLPCNSKKGRASFWNIMLEKQRGALTVKSLMFPLHLKAFQFTYKL